MLDNKVALVTGANTGIGRQTRSTSSNLGSASIRAHQTGIDTGDLPAADPRGESLRSRAEDNSSDESSTDSNTGGSAQDQEEQVDMTSATTSGPYKLRATQRTATEVESTIVILPRDQRPNQDQGLGSAKSSHRPRHCPLEIA